jgi:hypothetical protein
MGQLRFGFSLRTPGLTLRGAPRKKPQFLHFFAVPARSAGMLAFVAAEGATMKLSYEFKLT